MSKLVNIISWEDAITKAILECGGSATLKELYKLVPQIRKASLHLDTHHVIRAFLYRMSRVSGKLRKIGLGVYALPEAKLEQTIFENIQKGKTGKEIFKNTTDKEIHSYTEGMLLELGDIYGYLTYTADPSKMFNTKSLGEIATIEGFPNFTLPELLRVAKTFDVIWFKKRAMVTVPKYTFDVEITTDFSKALHRAYQFRDFRAAFYLISLKEKEAMYQRKIKTDPYNEIVGRFLFRSIDDVFSLYKSAVRHTDLKEKMIADIE